MAEEPVGVRRAGDTPSLFPAPGAGTAASAVPPTPDVHHPPELSAGHQPTVRIRVDIVPALVVLLAVSLLGLGIGWLWSLTAPPQRMRVLPEQSVPLAIETYHRFDDLAIFVLLCLGAGLCTGVGVWFLRARRGPVILLGALVGSVLAAWLAMRFGLVWAEARYAINGSPPVGDVVASAPQLESGWGALAWPLITALAYGGLAAWHGQDDLGRV